MNLFNLGPFELALIGIVALLVVGPRQLPELGRTVGKWMRTFRDAADEMKRGLYWEDDRSRSPYRPPGPSSAPPPPSETEYLANRMGSAETVESPPETPPTPDIQGDPAETDEVQPEKKSPPAFEPPSEPPLSSEGQD